MIMATTRTVLSIMGMRDNACRERIADALETVPGVCDVDVNLHRARATIVHEPPATLEALLGAIVRAGYGASLNGAAPERPGRDATPIGKGPETPFIDLRNSSRTNPREIQP
jgi:copper chaperone CopZ